MAEHIAISLVKAIIKNNKTIYGAKILILGLTFKENCPDIRNTKVIDIYRSLKDLGLHVDINDPWVTKVKPSLIMVLNFAKLLKIKCTTE